MGKLNYRNATFQDGASLMDFTTRWGLEEDIVSGAYCRHCGVLPEANDQELFWVAGILKYQQK